jgi:uncharacterized cupin superfamily protein
MKKLIWLLVLVGLTAAAQLRADLSVLSMSPEELRAMELEELPPWPAELILEGGGAHWQKELHRGEVAIALYASEPAVLEVSDPFPYDEFVLVVEGEVTLTPLDGAAKTYHVGDTFLVPKGWRGTWAMPVNYRELIVVETGAWIASGE